MKILHAIFSMNIGGAELMLTDIANAQHRAGHDVSVLVINNSVTKEVIDRLDHRIDLHLLGRPESSRNPLWIWRLNRAIARIAPDVVHLHNDSIMRMIFKRKRTKYTGTVHDTNIDIKHYKRCDAIFAISSSVHDDLKSRLGIDSLVIPNGIDFESIAQSDNKSIRNRPVKIVQVARVIPSKKGQDILIKAVGILKRKGIEATIDFFGKLNDDNELDILVADENVADRVRFMGALDRSYIYRHLKDYDLCCHPARYEGFGLVIVEAMAAKIPVISSNIEGPAEILQENRYGTLVESDNPQALADAIEQLANAYPIFKANAEGAAYHYAIKNYSIEATANKYLEEYKKLD